ncbi:MAG: hypothetical protein IPI45_04505 [Saprospiraceae bacterium]|nr:hypothetical protein [Saprospiraceae bacterium]MBK7737024.1 hypothetical protein [Saprospiraceae bacterium]MBK7914381.1 hypothetical protein [Saprospiraceae bacterium]
MNGLMQQMDPHFRAHPARYTHTEEVVMDGQRRIQLNDNNLLQNKHIIGLAVIRKLTNSKSPSGRTIVSDVVMDAAFLTIRSGQRDTLRDFPIALASKKADGTAGVGEYMQLSIPGGIVPNSSYIQIADGVTITANESFVLVWYYLPDEDANCQNPL